MKDNTIIINDRRKVYIFQRKTMLRREDMRHVRQQLKEEIREGCVLLPLYIELVSCTK